MCLHGRRVTRSRWLEHKMQSIAFSTAESGCESVETLKVSDVFVLSKSICHDEYYSK